MDEDLEAAEAALALVAGHAASDLQKTTTTTTKKKTEEEEKKGMGMVGVAHKNKGSDQAQSKGMDLETMGGGEDGDDLINDGDSQAATGTISHSPLPSSFGGSQRHSQASLQSLALTLDLDEDTAGTAEMGSGGGVSTVICRLRGGLQTLILVVLVVLS